MEEKMLLRNPETPPTTDQLENVMESQTYAVYEQILAILNELQLNPEWNYYKDGKAWLCKITHKKKTLLWLSAWEGFLKVSFYFTEKTRGGIEELDVSEAIKASFATAKPIGKLIPLTIDLRTVAQLSDFRKIVEYKKGLK